jgi:hypothetical protein
MGWHPGTNHPPWPLALPLGLHPPKAISPALTSFSHLRPLPHLQLQFHPLASNLSPLSPFTTPLAPSIRNLPLDSPGPFTYPLGINITFPLDPYVSPPLMPLHPPLALSPTLNPIRHVPLLAFSETFDQFPGRSSAQRAASRHHCGAL